MAPPLLWRQGDVLIQQMDELPPHVEKRSGRVLAHGEVTGHSHRVQKSRSAHIYSLRDGRGRHTLILEVVHETANIVHPEHATITLPRGVYRVWQQREETWWGQVRMAD